MARAEVIIKVRVIAYMSAESAHILAQESGSMWLDGDTLRFESVEVQIDNELPFGEYRLHADARKVT